MIDTSGFEFNENQDLREKTAPKEDAIKKTVKKKGRYEHQKIIKEMLALIASCKMDEELKMVLRMRIWGKDPEVFYPMTHEQIAMDLKCKVRHVKEWEEHGKENIKMFLKNFQVIDAVRKFHRDNLLKNTLNPEKRIQI